MDLKNNSENHKAEKVSEESNMLDKEFVYIDVLGFRDRHRFICKEFSLIDGDFKYHAIVKSPYSFSKLNTFFRRHAAWEVNFYHGLQYDCGDINII